MPCAHSQVSGLKVRVEYLGRIRDIIGSGREEEVEIRGGSTATDLFKMLSEKYGESFHKAVFERGSINIKSNILVTINALSLSQLDGAETKLKHDDRITLMPIVSAG